MKQIILKHTLKNALDFKGKANAKVVLGLVLKEDPSLKKVIPAVLKEIEKTCREVEKFSSLQIQAQLKKIAPEFLQEKKEKVSTGPLKPLPNAQKGKVVVRIAPSPSGPLHIGHAYGACLNYAYAEMYQGKFLVRIEDTNPENIYLPAYEMIEEDALWLTDHHVSRIYVQSSRLGTYYDHAEKLVQTGKAYVCTCNADEWRELKNKSRICPCRILSVKENEQRYAKMFTEYAEGEAVLRLKTSLTDKNPAMRDFGLMRIVEHVHPRTGKEQRVWPLMVFSVAVDDHEMGVTHVLNGKDHADNAAKEKIIMESFGWKPPEYKHWGRINFAGFAVSKSKTKLAIEEGKYTGWDDIRLPFLAALRRRGYQAGAFQKYALDIGLSLNDKTVSMEEFWKSINAYNRELVEPKANRFFFIDKPTKIKIAGAPKKEVTIDLHPNFPQRGKRKLKVEKEIYLSKDDVEKLEAGKLHRLMDYGNFEVSQGKYKFVSEDYEEYKNSSKKGLILHWLPVEKAIKAEVLLEDGTVAEGWGEENLRALREGEIVQLERRYFARIDQMRSNKIIFWYLHK